MSRATQRGSRSPQPVLLQLPGSQSDGQPANWPSRRITHSSRWRLVLRVPSFRISFLLSPEVQPWVVKWPWQQCVCNRFPCCPHTIPTLSGVPRPVRASRTVYPSPAAGLYHWSAAASALAAALTPPALMRSSSPACRLLPPPNRSHCHARRITHRFIQAPAPRTPQHTHSAQIIQGDQNGSKRRNPERPVPSAV